MKNLFNIFVLFITTTLLTAQAADIEFDLVPVDVSKDCNAIILKGTDRFKGTAYITPKVFLSVDQSGNRLFEIIPSGSGYIVQFGLYTPLNITNAENYRRSESNLMNNSCSYEKVRAALNKQDSKSPVVTLSPLNIRSIKVKIAGIDEPVILSNSSTDIFDFLGMDHIVEFRLNSKQELNEMIARMNGSIGLGINVSMEFKARASKNFLRVEFDSKEVTVKLGAALAGKKSIATAQLMTLISNTMKTVKSDVYMEGDDFSDLAKQLISDFLAATPASTATDTNTDTSTDTATDPVQEEPVVDPKAFKINGNDEPPTAAIPSGKVGINVNAFLTYLKKQQKISLKFQQMGDEELREFETSAIIRGDILSSNIKKHRILSDAKATTILNNLKKGDKISITLNERAVQQLTGLGTNSDASKLLSKEEILFSYELLSRAFKKIAGYSYNKLESSLTEDADHAGTLTETQKAWNFFVSPYKTVIYNWGTIVRFPNYNVAAPAVALNLKQTTLAAIPLVFSFSKLGSNKFKLQDLVGPNAMLKSTVDFTGGKIHFEASQDLGDVTVLNTEQIPDATNRPSLRELYQNTRGLWDPKPAQHFVRVGPVYAKQYRTVYSLLVESNTLEAFDDINPRPFSEPKKKVVNPARK